jgi:hypothetical protein
VGGWFFLGSVKRTKRSYLHQSSPRQTEGLKVGNGMEGWMGGWVGLKKLITVLG